LFEPNGAWGGEDAGASGSYDGRRIEVELMRAFDLKAVAARRARGDNTVLPIVDRLRVDFIRHGTDTRLVPFVIENVPLP